MPGSYTTGRRQFSAKGAKREFDFGRRRERVTGCFGWVIAPLILLAVAILVTR
jgi:hypothetical protein